MATEKRQRVRFTGKRTGLESIAIKGLGRVSVGDQIEVSLDEAERWTTELPMRDGKQGSDFAKVGEPFKVDEDDVAVRDLKVREKLMDQPEGKGETVEEFAEHREETAKAEDKKA